MSEHLEGTWEKALAYEGLNYLLCDLLDNLPPALQKRLAIFSVKTTFELKQGLRVSHGGKIVPITQQ